MCDFSALLLSQRRRRLLWRHIYAKVRRNETLFCVRRFMVARFLLLLVDRSLAFASIHAATVHIGGAQSLSLFAAAASIGLVLSRPVFGRLTDCRPGRVIVIAGLHTMPSGVIALTFREVASLQTPAHLRDIVVPIIVLRVLVMAVSIYAARLKRDKV